MPILPNPINAHRFRLMGLGQAHDETKRKRVGFLSKSNKDIGFEHSR